MCAYCGTFYRQTGRHDANVYHLSASPNCPYLTTINFNNGIELRPDHIHFDLDYGINLENLEYLGVLRHRMAKYQKYSTYDSRYQSYPPHLRTFLEPLEPLVNAGFFYRDIDQVCCFHCGGICSWLMKDPWVEHAECYPDCDFLHLVKGPQFIENVKENRNAKTLVSALVTPEMSECISPLVVDSKATRNVTDVEMARAFECFLVKKALEMDICRSRMSTIIKARLSAFGRMFDSLDDLLKSLICSEYKPTIVRRLIRPGEYVQFDHTYYEELSDDHFPWILRHRFGSPYYYYRRLMLLRSRQLVKPLFYERVPLTKPYTAAPMRKIHTLGHNRIYHGENNVRVNRHHTSEDMGDASPPLSPESSNASTAGDYNEDPRLIDPEYTGIIRNPWGGSSDYGDDWFDDDATDSRNNSLFESSSPTDPTLQRLFQDILVLSGEGSDRQNDPPSTLSSSPPAPSTPPLPYSNPFSYFQRQMPYSSVAYQRQIPYYQSPQISAYQRLLPESRMSSSYSRLIFQPQSSSQPHVPFFFDRLTSQWQTPQQQISSFFQPVLPSHQSQISSHQQAMPLHQQQMSLPHQQQMTLSHQQTMVPHQQTMVSHQQQAPSSHQQQMLPSHQQQIPPTCQQQVPSSHQQQMSPSHQQQIPSTHQQQISSSHQQHISSHQPQMLSFHQQTPSSHLQQMPSTYQSQMSTHQQQTFTSSSSVADTAGRPSLYPPTNRYPQQMSSSYRYNQSMPSTSSNVPQASCMSEPHIFSTYQRQQLAPSLSVAPSTGSSVRQPRLLLSNLYQQHHNSATNQSIRCQNRTPSANLRRQQLCPAVSFQFRPTIQDENGVPIFNINTPSAIPIVRFSPPRVPAPPPPFSNVALSEYAADTNAPLQQPSQLLNGQDTDTSDDRENVGSSTMADEAERNDGRDYYERKVKVLEEENRNLKESKLCKVCMDHDVDVIFIKCGHLCVCSLCASSTTTCPICREVIVGTIRAYLS